MLQRKPKNRLFRGFSSTGKVKPVTEVIDIELIKQDILNHFHTIPGERVMRPTFGSVIWDFLFDPYLPEVVQEIRQNAEDIINNDSRVDLKNLIFTEYEHGLKMHVEVIYRGIDAAGTFDVEFDRRNSVSEANSEEF